MKRGEMLDKMLHIAVNAHHGQFDKGGNPYILHPLKVMHYLKTDDEELQCMALLHDVVEDCDVTFVDLEAAGMSKRVIDAVRCLTKQRGQTLAEYKDEIQTTGIEYYKQLVESDADIEIDYKKNNVCTHEINESTFNPYYKISTDKNATFSNPQRDLAFF